MKKQLSILKISQENTLSSMTKLKFFVDTEDITKKKRENPDNLNEQASVHPLYLPIEYFKDSIDHFKEPVYVAIYDKGNNKTFTNLTKNKIDL